jgi:hypothetical protein
MNKISDYLSKLSLDKYNNYTNEINKLCIESAEKGNIHIILTKKELDELNFPIDEYNFKLLRIFLQEEGLLIDADHIEPRFEIFWLHSVISIKTGNKTESNEISAKFPPMSDKDIKKLLINDDEIEYPILKFKKNLKPKTVQRFDTIDMTNNSKCIYNDIVIKNFDISDNELKLESELESENRSSYETGSCDGSDDNIFDIKINDEDINKITNMTNYVKTMIDKSNKIKSYRDKERILYTMFLTIIKVENQQKIKNKYIFKNKSSIDDLINKLKDMLLENKMYWPNEMITEFEEIRNSRFPEKETTSE